MYVPLVWDILRVCLILAGTSASGGEVVPVRVYGLIKQSIVLSPVLRNSSFSVQIVFWNFKSLVIATYSNNQLTVLMNQFKGRLEVLDNGRSLRIGQLSLEDRGLYTGSIILSDSTRHDGSYNLSVYEPVPVPSIRIVEKNSTGDWCNVTLQCYVPRHKSSLSYSWKYRLRDSDHQPYDKSGDTIHTSTVIDDSWDMEFICIVENPADRKNVSVQKVCLDNGGRRKSSEKGNRNRKYYALLAVLLTIMLLTFIGLCVLKMRKERKKGEIPGEPKNEELQYIQVTTNPPRGDRQEWTNSLYDASPRQNPKSVTLYAVLEHPPQKDGIKYTGV